MSHISILVASPSPVNRARISKVIAALPEVEVIAVTGDLSETFTWAEAREPDLVVIANEFRRLEEFDAMKSLFYALDARWIGIEPDARHRIGKIVRGPSGQMFPEPMLDLTMSPDVVRAQIRQAMSITRTYGNRPRPMLRKAPPALYDRLVVIGSSTGGVDALLTLLSDYPVDCPPTAIVQHTGKGFSESLIHLLERRCRPQVVAARDGLILRQGLVCVAGGTDGHMLLSGASPLRCTMRPGPPISGHTPSVDALFRSVLPMAPNVVGVLLTGMGQDGAAGLFDLRQAGCNTIGQDEASSVVYGMPKAAWEMGAVQRQLPIHKIGAEILHLCMPSTVKPAIFGERSAAR